MNFVINVADKIATVVDAPVIICGNSDYVIDFTFDSKWDEYVEKTARFKFKKDGKKAYIDVLFSGTRCNVPILSNIDMVEIGVYAGNLSTTTGARVDCEKSILCGDGVHTPPPEDVYNQLLETFNKGVKNNPDRHVEYFTITDDGIVSLKPEYRGACPSNRSQYTFAISDNGIGNVGSKNAELPKCLYIPEVVGNVAVYELAPAMFINNQAIVGIVCPTTVNEIPERFCSNTIGLKSVYGTENIECIGKGAFSGSGVEKLYFPNLKEFGGTGVFSNSSNLIFVDIGNVTTIPNSTFSNNLNLNRIKNSAEITSIGNGAFYLSGNLKNIDFIPTLTSIGEGAFLQSRYTYDWDTLTNCTFGTNATSKQINPTDYWNGCTFTPHKNNLPTLLSQEDTEWASRNIGTTSWTYSQGCVLFSYMHIYCSLHNLKLSTVLEWENIMAEADPNLINTFSTYIRDSVTYLGKLGLKAEYHSSITSTEDAQGIYDALSNGKCVILEVPSVYIDTQGHAVIAYGVNECGELLIANSSGFTRDGVYPKAATYTVSPKNIPSANEYCIVSL